MRAFSVCLLLCPTRISSCYQPLNGFCNVMMKKLYGVATFCVCRNAVEMEQKRAVRKKTYKQRNAECFDVRAATASRKSAAEKKKATRREGKKKNVFLLCDT